MFFLSDLQKIFIRKFKVSSASEEDDEEEHDDGYVYYRWRIQLKFINAQGATLQSEPFVEKVTFELHPDFDTPRRGKERERIAVLYTAYTTVLYTFPIISI